MKYHKEQWVNVNTGKPANIIGRIVIPAIMEIKVIVGYSGKRKEKNIL